ncbi:MAG: GH36-type glycosyl hydrolase domain-containing protein [Steroidobacteraceae bacterium]
MSEALIEPTARRLTSRSGLRLQINANGSLCRFDCEAISLTLFVGNEIEGGPANLYLRRHGETLEWTPLLGPSSRTAFELDAANARLVGSGSWLGINYRLALVLAQNAPAWFWHVHLENTNPAPQQVDLTYAQDLALAPYGAVRLNEYYVSQYIDHTPLTQSPHGLMIASRQNLAVDGRNPWSLIGSMRNGISFATDALQFHGLAVRAGDAPAGLAADLPGRRLQHEHSMVVIRDAPLQLDPGASVDAGFFGAYRADHPDATSTSDLGRVNEILALPEAAPFAIESVSAEPLRAATLFSRAAFLNGRNFDAEGLRTWFGSEWTHEELDEGGEYLSFFHSGDCHVVLSRKELRVQRPHGHILRTGHHMTPDETALTSTAWMSGVFHSMLTQGHVSINRFLSTVHSYLGLFRSHGQRVFIELGGTWRLLNVPSAFEMSPDSCRWIYSHDEGVIQVRAEARSEPHELTLSVEVSSGAPARLLICHHVALNDDDGSTPGKVLWRRDGADIIVTPSAGTDLARRFPNGSFHITPMSGTEAQCVGGDELLFIDGRSRGQPFLCIVTAPAASIGLRFRGDLIPGQANAPLRVDSGDALVPRLTLGASPPGPLAARLAGIPEIVPWFTHNALVHYLSPRGLEQFSGGGWGTRDVCQGPVEMLLALDRIEPMRDLLLRVMSAQNPDGDWPQWFMFFEREREIRAGDSHGDIVFWPLLALAQYLVASGDAGVLDATVPFFDSRGSNSAEHATVWQHAQRALALVEKRVIPSTALAAYGHGDWNDSLQPADPVLREHMCSAWTVTLHFQALRELARAMRVIGRTQDAARFEKWAEVVQRDFQRFLLVDGVLAGYAHFEAAGRVRYLLHPSDQTTGVRYSSLAMIHAILEDMLTPEQAREHLRLIDTHLSAPDGARLFDRPMPYHGGLQRIFQRAETATFFGREIGLMYMHAHLRYAQALAHLGEADRFFHALCQANPVGIRSIVPGATLRQANCYYSSSDAAFEDRYQASAEYERVAGGTIALDGGWRVYSSGAGIALGLIVRRFLGLGCEADVLRIDPVIPGALDGLRVGTTLLKRPIEVHYRIGKAGCGVSAIALNGQPLPFTCDTNPHRRGAALVSRAAMLQRLATDRNILKIDIA